MFRLVLSTCKPEEAEGIADALVNEGLAASVNILPGVTTKVRFKGEVRTQQESVLLIRTRDDLVWKLERRYLELNSWEVPEVAAIAIKEWNAAYHAWLIEATRQRG